MEIQMSNTNCDNVSKQPTKPRKKNALAHGLYGEDILLPWESRKDFEKLLADLCGEFPPDGRKKNEIVFDIAHLRWQKYRLHQMYIAAAYEDPFVSDLVKAGRKSWAGIRNHLKRNSEHERAMSDMLTQSFFSKRRKKSREQWRRLCVRVS